MPDLELKIVAGEELGAEIENAASRVHGVVVERFKQAKFDLRSAMARNIEKNFHRRSGALEDVVVEDDGELEARVGVTVEYGEIQERGGTITAKNARNLTIPLEAFMTGRGIARGSARDVIADPGSFGFDGTFFSKGILFGKQGDDAVALFLLKPSVTLPARPYTQPAVDEVQPTFEASMREALEALL